MSHLTDKFKTEEVSKYFRYVIDDRSYTKKRRRSTIILNSNCNDKTVFFIFVLKLKFFAAFYSLASAKTGM